MNPRIAPTKTNPPTIPPAIPPIAAEDRPLEGDGAGVDVELMVGVVEVDIDVVIDTKSAVGRMTLVIRALYMIVHVCSATDINRIHYPALDLPLELSFSAVQSQWWAHMT